jgi:hypothetical protein
MVRCLWLVAYVDYKGRYYCCLTACLEAIEECVAGPAIGNSAKKVLLLSPSAIPSLVFNYEVLGILKGKSLRRLFKYASSSGQMRFN